MTCSLISLSLVLQAVKAAVALHELQRSKGVCEGAEEREANDDADYAG